MFSNLLILLIYLAAAPVRFLAVVLLGRLVEALLVGAFFVPTADCFTAGLPVALLGDFVSGFATDDLAVGLVVV